MVIVWLIVHARDKGLSYLVVRRDVKDKTYLIWLLDGMWRRKKRGRGTIVLFAVTQDDSRNWCFKVEIEIIIV